MSNLRFIKQEKSTSPVSSMTITDCFSSDYDVYNVIITNTDYGVSNTDNAAVMIRFINSNGEEVDDSNYDTGNMFMKANQTKDEDKFTNGTYMYSSVNIGNQETAGANHWIMSPYNSDSYTYVLGEGSSGYDISSNLQRSSRAISGLKQTTSMTGIKFYSANASNTFTATIAVYGLRID